MHKNNVRIPPKNPVFLTGIEFMKQYRTTAAIVRMKYASAVHAQVFAVIIRVTESMALEKNVPLSPTLSTIFEFTKSRFVRASAFVGSSLNARSYAMIALPILFCR